MEDFKKLGWVVFNIIVYIGWISLIYYLDKMTGLNKVDSIVYVIFHLLIQWVGGIFVVIYVQEFVQRKIN
tara:strand:- start:131 stop:340 length:210 start_codon:yes stop_codon:yes gene_type:complete